MFVNKIPMLTAINKSIKFRSLVLIRGRESAHFYEALYHTFRCYNSAGFKITMINCDNEFKPVMDDVKDELETDMNPYNPGDHCPEAERNNRTIQERIRVGYYRLPYNWLPRVLVKQLALVSVDMLNVFPVKGGVSSYYSPNMIMKGKGLDYKKHCQIPFGPMFK